MDLAQAIEFSRYASRLRDADPTLFEEVVGDFDQPFNWNGSPLDGVAQGAPAERWRGGCDAFGSVYS